MSLASPFRLKCASIPYRQGFIEVTPAIHEECVNLEIWKIDTAISLESASWIDDPNLSLSDSCVTANCELEMTVAEARSLAEAILESLRSLES